MEVMSETPDYIRGIREYNNRYLESLETNAETLARKQGPCPCLKGLILCGDCESQQAQGSDWTHDHSCCELCTDRLVYLYLPLLDRCQNWAVNSLGHMKHPAMCKDCGGTGFIVNLTEPKLWTIGAQTPGFGEALLQVMGLPRLYHAGPWFAIWSHKTEPERVEYLSGAILAVDTAQEVA